MTLTHVLAVMRLSISHLTLVKTRRLRFGQAGLPDGLWQTMLNWTSSFSAHRQQSGRRSGLRTRPSCRRMASRRQSNRYSNFYQPPIVAGFLTHHLSTQSKQPVRRLRIRIWARSSDARVKKPPRRGSKQRAEKFARMQAELDARLEQAELDARLEQAEVDAQLERECEAGGDSHET